MRIAILFMLSGICLVSRAQPRDTAVLLEAIVSHPAKDTFRVNHLTSLATIVSFKITRRMDFLEEAIAISRSIHYPRGEGTAMTKKAGLLWQQGQKESADSLLSRVEAIGLAAEDYQVRIFAFLERSNEKQNIDNKAALKFALRADELAEESGNKQLLTKTKALVTTIYQTSLSDYPKAMEYAFKTMVAAEETNCEPCLVRAWMTIGSLYSSIESYDSALTYLNKALEGVIPLSNKGVEASIHLSKGELFRVMGQYPAAIEEFELSKNLNQFPQNIEIIESNLADIYISLDSLELAFKYAYQSLTKAEELEDIEGLAWIRSVLARAWLKKGNADSVLSNGLSGLTFAIQTDALEFKRDNAKVLATGYAMKRDFAKAYQYHLVFINYRDSMEGVTITKKTNWLQYSFDLGKKETQIAVLEQQKKSQQRFLTSMGVILLLIAAVVIVLIRNNRQKQQANKKIAKAYKDLTLTQAQLIQSEKMASLGQLTAGIAHEIQNPLNFVNNFAEVNCELLAEMKTAIGQNNLTEIQQLTEDINQNEQKIRQHGQRADGIVKSMLQHSRNASGQKEHVNVNVLSGDCLQLAYLAAQSANPGFKANLQTDFDLSLPSLHIAAGDVSKVLLNLCNNSFYSLAEKAKAEKNDFEPAIILLTKKLDENIQITVTDNGVGIAPAFIDKIFQPFFTTKPTGQGTGLGLSIAYDIIKSYGGNLSVLPGTGSGATFILTLPITN